MLTCDSEIEIYLVTGFTRKTLYIYYNKY